MSAHRHGRGAHRVLTEAPTPEEIRRTGRVITGFTWVLTGAVVMVSMSTAAPFIDAHSPGSGTGPVMAVAVDGCFILSLQSDSTLSRYGVAGGTWPSVFRWVTGLATVWLNIGAAALTKDLVGVLVHLIPPLLLLLVAEAGPAYRRALAALARNADERDTAEPDDPFEDADGPLYTVAPTACTALPTPPPAAPATVAGWRVPTFQGPSAAVSGARVGGVSAHPVPTPASTVPTPTAPAPAEVAPAAIATTAESLPEAEPDAEVPTGEHPADADAPTLDPGEHDDIDGEDAGADGSEEVPGPVRLSEAEAAAVIEECWRNGVSQREAARRATRVPSFVGRVYKRLDAQHQQLATTA